jgi:hypothetical protein
VEAFRDALTGTMSTRFDPLKHRYKVLQVFFNRRNLVWSIFDRFPELVKLDTVFGELEGNGDNSYA